MLQYNCIFVRKLIYKKFMCELFKFNNDSVVKRYKKNYFRFRFLLNRSQKYSKIFFGRIIFHESNISKILKLHDFENNELETSFNNIKK